MKRLLYLLATGVLLLGGCLARDPGTLVAGGGLPVPASQTDRHYLGVTSDTGTFRLHQIPSDVVLIQFLRKRCHLCKKAAPGSKDLYELIQRRFQGSRVRMVGIAINCDADEAATLAAQYDLPYPVIPDEQNTLHVMLGCDRVPSLAALHRTDSGRLEVFFRKLGYYADAELTLNRILDRWPEQ